MNSFSDDQVLKVMELIYPERVYPDSTELRRIIMIVKNLRFMQPGEILRKAYERKDAEYLKICKASITVYHPDFSLGDRRQTENCSYNRWSPVIADFQDLFCTFSMRNPMSDDIQRHRRKFFNEIRDLTDRCGGEAAAKVEIKQAPEFSKLSEYEQEKLFGIFFN